MNHLNLYAFFKKPTVAIAFRALVYKLKFLQIHFELSAEAPFVVEPSDHINVKTFKSYISVLLCSSDKME